MGYGSWGFIACYKDNKARNFKQGPTDPNCHSKGQGNCNRFFKNANTAAHECMVHCGQYKYVALQAGGQCFCGNSYGKNKIRKRDGKPLILSLCVVQASPPTSTARWTRTSVTTGGEQAGATPSIATLDLHSISTLAATRTTAPA